MVNRGLVEPVVASHGASKTATLFDRTIVRRAGQPEGPDDHDALVIEDELPEQPAALVDAPLRRGDARLHARNATQRKEDTHEHHRRHAPLYEALGGASPPTIAAMHAPALRGGQERPTAAPARDPSPAMDGHKRGESVSTWVWPGSEATAARRDLR
tara:strand:+ start:246 stop:716 length:471 start_codon:yes stop_codon:yes gene_type:complete